MLLAGEWALRSTGKPNGPGLSRWPVYRSPDYQLLAYGDTAAMDSNEPELVKSEVGSILLARTLTQIRSTSSSEDNLIKGRFLRRCHARSP